MITIKKERSVFFRVVPLLAMVFLIGCSQPPEPREIRIGVIAPLTGDSDARWGKSYVNGAMLAAGRINKEGGLLVDGHRHKVTLTFADSQGNPQIALNVARKLITRYSVAGLVGAPRSQVALPVSALAESRRIPFVTSMATHPDVTREKRYAYRAIFSDADQARALARFARNSLEAVRAAVLFEVTNADSSSLARHFKSQFEALGGDVVAFENYISGDESWDRQFEEIKESGAQLLFLPNYGNEVPRQARLARESGLNMPFIGGDSWWGIESGKDRLALEGGFFSTDYTLDLTTPENKAFLAAYRESYKVDPNGSAAHMYDAMGLLFEIIKANGTEKGEPSKTVMGPGTYAGATGAMRFKVGGDPEKEVRMIQIRDGKFVRL